MGEKGERTIALGNRLKELRHQHNLTISGLADMLGISHSYVGFLEKGTRRGSKGILKRYADFFQVSEEELLKLQMQVSSSTRGDMSPEAKQTTDELTELTELLSRLNEDVQTTLIEQFKKQVENTLYSLLTPYDMSDLKRNITKVKKSWFCEEGSSIDKPESQRGYVNLPSGRIYFSLDVDESGLHLQLLYEDRKQITIFENWLGECSVSYTTDESIQHMKEPQKVLNVVWLSPNMSYRQHYLHLVKEKLLSYELNYSDARLAWYIHHYDHQIVHSS